MKNAEREKCRMQSAECRIKGLRRYYILIFLEMNLSYHLKLVLKTTKNNRISYFYSFIIIIKSAGLPKFCPQHSAFSTLKGEAFRNSAFCTLNSAFLNEHFTKEAFKSFAFRILEDFLRCALFLNYTFVEEYNTRTNLFSKAHFVSYNNHCHTL